MRLALDVLALRAEEWLLSVAGPDWVQRYGRPVRYERLPRGTEAVRRPCAAKVGQDGIRLLEALYDPQAPAGLRDLPAVQVLRQVWIQQGTTAAVNWAGAGRSPSATGPAGRGVRRRDTGSPEADGRPGPATTRVPWASVEIVTPHDPGARYSQKVTPSGQREWIGYRDHRTEACGQSRANVIVQVVTRPATEQDIDAPDRIHQGIAAQDLRPTERLVDGGYTSPDSIHHAAQQWNIDLAGPVRADHRAAERPGFAKEDFHVKLAGPNCHLPNSLSVMPSSIPMRPMNRAHGNLPPALVRAPRARDPGDPGAHPRHHNPRPHVEHACGQHQQPRCATGPEQARDGREQPTHNAYRQHREDHTERPLRPTQDTAVAVPAAAPSGGLLDGRGERGVRHGGPSRVGPGQDRAGRASPPANQPAEGAARRAHRCSFQSPGPPSAARHAFGRGRGRESRDRDPRGYGDFVRCRHLPGAEVLGRRSW